MVGVALRNQHPEHQEDLQGLVFVYWREGGELVHLRVAFRETCQFWRFSEPDAYYVLLLLQLYIE